MRKKRAQKSSKKQQNLRLDLNQRLPMAFVASFLILSSLTVGGILVKETKPKIAYSNVLGDSDAKEESEASEKKETVEKKEIPEAKEVKEDKEDVETKEVTEVPEKMEAVEAKEGVETKETPEAKEVKEKAEAKVKKEIEELDTKLEINSDKNGGMEIQISTGKVQTDVLPTQVESVLVNSNLKPKTDKSSGKAKIELVDEQGEAVYKAEVEVEKKFLGFMPVSIVKTVSVSTKNAQVLKTKNKNFLNSILALLSF